MAKSAIAGLFFWAWAALLSAAQPIVDLPESSGVTVRVYNYAGVDRPILATGL